MKMNNKNEQVVSDVPSLALAYIGDAVYELMVRGYLISSGLGKVKDLHREAVRYVKAKSQARVMHSIEQKLSEQELGVVKRGRNAKSGTVPKNTELVDYKYATAFEALIGYLHLSMQEERKQEIFKLALEVIEQTEGE